MQQADEPPTCVKNSCEAFDQWTRVKSVYWTSLSPQFNATSWPLRLLPPFWRTALIWHFRRVSSFITARPPARSLWRSTATPSRGKIYGDLQLWSRTDSEWSKHTCACSSAKQRLLRCRCSLNSGIVKDELREREATLWLVFGSCWCGETRTRGGTTRERCRKAVCWQSSSERQLISTGEAWALIRKSNRTQTLLCFVELARRKQPRRQGKLPT